MNISIKRCDKCKKEVRSDTQKSDYDMFGCIRCEFPAYGGTDSRYIHASAYLELCQECLAKVGITPRPAEVKAVSDGEQKKLSERLYDIMCELVQELQH